MGKQQVMAEELKNQAAEHMPPIVKMAADVMFPELKQNERVKALFKLMESGELDPNTLLPKLAKLMQDMSEPMMEKYWGTLAYRMGLLRKTSENIFRDFMGAGGERGLAYIVRGLEQLIGSTTINMATWGRIFEGAGRAIGDVFLGMRDLTEYVSGIKHPDNIFEKMFGAPEDNPTLQTIKAFFSEIFKLATETKNLLFALEGSEIVTLLKGMTRGFVDEITKAMSLLTGVIRISTSMVTAMNQGKNPLDAGEKMVKRIAKEEEVVEKFTTQVGRPPTPVERTELFNAIDIEGSEGDAGDGSSFTDTITKYTAVAAGAGAALLLPKLFGGKKGGGIEGVGEIGKNVAKGKPKFLRGKVTSLAMLIAQLAAGGYVGAEVVDFFSGGEIEGNLDGEKHKKGPLKVFAGEDQERLDELMIQGAAIGGTIGVVGGFKGTIAGSAGGAMVGGAIAGEEAIDKYKNAIEEANKDNFWYKLGKVMGASTPSPTSTGDFSQPLPYEAEEVVKPKPTPPVIIGGVNTTMGVGEGPLTYLERINKEVAKVKENVPAQPQENPWDILINKIRNWVSPQEVPQNTPLEPKEPAKVSHNFGGEITIIVKGVPEDAEQQAALGNAIMEQMKEYIPEFMASSMQYAKTYG